MKLAVATPTPEVKTPISVALLSGSFAERLQKAARLGYDGLELMVVRPDELDAQRIRAQMTASGLEVAAVASGAISAADGLTLLMADTEMARQAVTRLHALIDFAAELGAPLVTIGSFRGWLAWAGGAQAWPRLTEILGAAANRAAARGIRLALEPLNRYESDVINNATEGLGLIDQIDHDHLGLLLDTYHVNIEESSLTDCFRQVMAVGRLWHVHLGENNRLPPGQGHLDFPGIVDTLRETSYRGYLSAELLARPDPDAAAVATIRYMRKLVPAGAEGEGQV
jgi:sugar phosphate isomerase/epimerase